MKKIKLLTAVLFLAIVALSFEANAENQIGVAQKLNLHEKVGAAELFNPPLRFTLEVYNSSNPTVLDYTIRIYAESTYTGSLGSSQVVIEVTPAGTYDIITPIGVTGTISADPYPDDLFITKVKFYHNFELVEIVF